MNKNIVLLNIDKARRYINIAQGEMLKIGMVNESFVLISIYERLLKLTEAIENGAPIESAKLVIVSLPPQP